MKRTPAVAGAFYPASALALKAQIGQCFESAAQLVGLPHSHAPKAIIAPHAGYVYSGAVAASAYKLFEPVADRIKKLVLLGPSHRVGFKGVALTRASHYTTPLGDVALDGDLAEKVLACPLTGYLDEVHGPEHSLEVHVPFMQTLFSDFTLLPLVCGQGVDASVLADILEACAGGDETAIVVSTDLSHFLDYKTAKQVDGKTIEAIAKLAGDKIAHDDACGRVPVRGLLEYATRHNMDIGLLDARNSADTAGGDKNRVVGYASFALWEKQQ